MNTPCRVAPFPSWAMATSEEILADIQTLLTDIAQYEPIHIICDRLDYQASMTGVRYTRKVSFRKE